MIPIRADIHSLTGKGYFGPASILDFCDGKYRVKFSSDDLKPEGNPVWATPALSASDNLQWGDTVLLAGDDMTSLYIIGIINARADQKTLMLKDGTYAKTQINDESEKLSVFSKQGEMVFEYDSATGKTSVNIKKGDLEFVTQDGSIDFVASKGIRFFSENPIEIKSLENIKLTAKKMETVVETIMEKAKNIYQTIENLTQLKTGRLRTLVQGTTHVKTLKAFYKAEEDFKIKGKKIHLG